MQRKYPGYFITFEGPDGSGKTSCVETLATALREATERQVITTREPGGSPAAEKLRAVVLSEPVSARAEVLIFGAARMDHLDALIYPALSRGDIVLCDRFADSTYAYQGEGRGLINEVKAMEQQVLGGFEPDYTLFFDVTFEESERRMAARASAGGENTLFDRERAEFKRRVYVGYQKRFHENPHRMVRVNALAPLEEVRSWLRYWAQTVVVPKIQKG